MSKLNIKLKQHVIILVTIGIFILITHLLFGRSCLLYLMTKVCCPFCGMTRAHLSAIQFDFKQAMEYHPLFFLGIPYLYLIFHGSLKIFKNHKMLNIIRITLLIIMTILLLLIYIIRVSQYGFRFI